MPRELLSIYDTTRALSLMPISTMGRYDLEYPKDAANTVKRHDERASYSLKAIHTLINISPFINIAFNTPSSPFPVVLPMIGQMGSFARPSAGLGDPLDLYVHGYISSRLMREGGGLAVCVSATHVDGLVLALSAFNHDYNYRSAVLFGHAQLVESEEEKLYAMELITNSVVPDRWKDTRLPINKAELQSTGMLKIKIESGSAKIREGQASEQKHDLENQELVDKTWTGVLPMYQSIGEPVPGLNGKVEVPEYIKEFVAAFNTRTKEHSVAVTKK